MRMLFSILNACHRLSAISEARQIAWALRLGGWFAMTTLTVPLPRVEAKHMFMCGETAKQSPQIVPTPRRDKPTCSCSLLDRSGVGHKGSYEMHGSHD